MKVVHVVNQADAQSIPLELALAIQEQVPMSVVAGYYARGDHPADHDETRIVSLDATKALDWAAVARLRRLLREEQPDIVHMHHAVSAFWCTLLGLLAQKRPRLVKTEHNDHKFLPWHQRAINTLIYPFISRIVCNSDTTRASFTWLENLLAGRRAQRIYNGVNLTRVRAHPRPEKLPASPIVIGNIGRLVPQKNQHRLIQGLAAARAASDCELRLEIVGTGPLKDELAETARICGVSHAVTFAGALPREAVYERLSGWHGFVMASNFEGFCNALVEALAACLPAAVSDIETLREVGGDAAIRFDHTDPEAIGAALVALAGLPRTDGRFADRYAIDLAVDNHLALYRDLMTDSARVPHPQEARLASGPQSGLRQERDRDRD
ncbi:MAG: glycosyltransferase [Pseudomonadota bacterium]